MGRPQKFESPEEMGRQIDAYFDNCAGELLRDDDGKYVLDKGGNPVTVGARPPTLTGLALWLGLSGRQALQNYKGRKEFRELITGARARVEQYAEERLYDRDGQRGAEFNLRCNFGWAREETQKESGGVIVLGKVVRDDAET